MPSSAPDPIPAKTAAAMNAARRRAQRALDRMPALEDWSPRPDMLATFLRLKMFGATTARELYDWLVADLTAEIKNPSPRSVEILADGTKRYGYGTHKEKPSATSAMLALPPASIAHTPTARHHPHP